MKRTRFFQEPATGIPALLYTTACCFETWRGERAAETCPFKLGSSKHAGHWVASQLSGQLPADSEMKLRGNDKNVRPSLPKHLI